MHITLNTQKIPSKKTSQTTTPTVHSHNTSPMYAKASSKMNTIENHATHSIISKKQDSVSPASS
jgi:hypothetical protein